MSAPSFSLVGLGPIINRWKYFVAGAVALAAIVSIIVALLLPNVYRSTAIFIPTNPQTADPDRLLEPGSQSGSKLELGGRAEDLDRVITIGESQPVAEIIIKQFNLYKHYKAGEPGDDAVDNFVLSEFSNNLSIVHNERDAIELTFMDKDKKLAAAVANALVHAIDSINQQLTLENRRTVLNLYRQRYQYLSTSYERSRRELVGARHRYGIFGLEMQGRYMVKQLIETEAALRKAEASGGDVAGLKRSLRGLTRADGGNLINLEKYVAGTDSLAMFTTRVADLQGRLIAARSAFETAELSIKGRLSSVYLVQKAYPATKKFKPVRSLIVLGSMLLTFALSVVFIALLELYRYNRPGAVRPA
ncbi:GumC domain-containing protein [Hymenobacter ruber]